MLYFGRKEHEEHTGHWFAVGDHVTWTEREYINDFGSDVLTDFAHSGTIIKINKKTAQVLPNSSTKHFFANLVDLKKLSFDEDWMNYVIDKAIVLKEQLDERQAQWDKEKEIIATSAPGIAKELNAKYPGRKIENIKILREMTGYGIAQAKSLIENA